MRSIDKKKICANIKSMKRQELDPLIKKIVDEKQAQILDATIRDIQDEIYSRTGNEVSTSVVSASLRRLGLEASGHRWAYRHNPGRGE